MGRMAFLAALICLCGTALATPPMMRANQLRPLTIVVLPDRATALYVRHSARLTPAGRNWAALESQRLAGGALDPSAVAGDAAQTCTIAMGACSGGDIEALVMIVMMQAASDADQDLKDIMAEVKANNSAKSQMRAAMQRMRMSRVKSAQELNADMQSVKNGLDSMSDMSEMESMRLQMAMDRYSKLMEALSNIMKKMSDTNGNIINNLK